MKKSGIALFSALVLFGATGASAQVNATASITIPTLLQITVDQTAVTFPQPTLSDYTTGNLSSPVTSTVSTWGNVSHDVMITADAGVMTFTASTGAADPNKPASDLQWSADTGTTWNSLSTTAGLVADALAKGINNSAAAVTYRMLLNVATDEPGTYSLGFTYTVVAN